MRQLTWLILALTFLVHCYSPQPPGSEEGAPEWVRPNQETWNFTIEFADGGRKTAVVRAGHMALFKNSNLYVLDDSVVIDFFGKDGTHSSRVRADSAFVEDNGSRMRAVNNVDALSESGVTIITGELRWEEAKGRIFTDLDVRVISENDTMYGTGFESDQDMLNWTILKARGVSRKGIPVD